MKTPHVKLIGPSPLRLGFLLTPLALVCLALLPQARAVCQDGCLFLGNTVLGDDALSNNTGGFDTAIGAGALFGNTTGSSNTAIGFDALHQNNTGDANTATGDSALFSNTTGEFNTATGSDALAVNSTGFVNTAIGASALQGNSTGNNNTAIGFKALFNNATGINNIALGVSAGTNLTTGSNNIDIGNAGIATETGIIRIGTAGTQAATFIAGIREAALAHGTAVAVGVTADGQLGVRASSARFKDNIKPMDKASEAIFSLQPVTFRYKKDLAALPQFGLVAEEVAKVNPDLVARDVEGKPFTVRYDEINAMLLNEFLKEHKTVQEQGATIAELKHNLAEQQKQIEALTAGLQKVSAQIELSRPAPHTVLNDQ
jgi:hypothetical protein